MLDEDLSIRSRGANLTTVEGTAITYAIPDIHGRLDLLVKAIDRIDADVLARGRPPYKIVFLGDYIDRGPESARVVGLLRALEINEEAPVVCLEGNHEDIMWQTATFQIPNTNWWDGNGGGWTMRSYGLKMPPNFQPDIVQFLFREDDKREALENLMDDAQWFHALPLWHEDEHRIYVHAGIPDEHAALEDQDPHDLIWMRYGDRGGADYGWRGKHVVHGHTSNRAPMKLTNRTNLDGSAYELGKLFIGVFDDDKPGGPVDILVAEA